MKGGRECCGLWDKLYSGIGRSKCHVIGNVPIKEKRDRTFVFDSDALNGWFAVPLADVEGRSHYGRMEAESGLILLPPAFEHVDSDHLCRLICKSPCSPSLSAETARTTDTHDSRHAAATVRAQR